MKIEIFTICDAATDSYSKLNLLGSFDTIASPTAPVVHPACAIALKIRFDAADEGQHEIEFRLTDPDGKNVIAPLKGGMEAPKVGQMSSVSRNFILNIQHLSLPAFGEYAFEVRVDGTQRGQIPLYVLKAQQA